MSKLLLPVWLLAVSSAPGQQQNFREVDLSGNSHYLCSIELSKDNRTLAIATAEGHLLFWDIETQTVTREYVFDGFKHGPYMSYSADGRYLLLLEQYFTDWALNKDRPSRAAVVDAESGKVLLSREQVNAAHFTPDSRSLVTLEGNEIIFRNIESDKVEKRFNPPNVSNSFGISTDGTIVVAAPKPTEDDLKNTPSLRTTRRQLKRLSSIGKWQSPTTQTTSESGMSSTTSWTSCSA